ncbi:hypothetical protein B0H17DRAFT_1076850 [Mycena rosella]|uniref:Secreted protein n=1 Tax=Mycena rosella TaxID=1033263 RepID=A0AAD7D7D4_MYCRO|nr:hypothetical protein B0H17DRAFT_1076850 [Mycena rosella]
MIMQTLAALHFLTQAACYSPSHAFPREVAIQSRERNLRPPRVFRSSVLEAGAVIRTGESLAGDPRDGRAIQDHAMPPCSCRSCLGKNT